MEMHLPAMRKFIFPAILLISLPLAAQTNNVHVTPGRVGVVLMAASKDGLAVATDGAQFNADGTASEVQKLFQVGKQGAILFAGNVSIQDPVDRPVREEVNVARIAKGWLDSHPDAAPEMANSEINNLVLQTLTKFFSTRRPGKQAGTYLFKVIGVSIAGGKLQMTSQSYFLPLAQSKAPRIEKTSGGFKPGEFQGDGDGNVVAELLGGKSAAFKKFKEDPAIKKFHATQHERLSVEDFVDVFNVVLAAAESDQGKKFSHGTSIVSPPNRFAIISSKDGFAWKKQ